MPSSSINGNWARALAALSVAVALPFAVIAPLSGVWADRLLRKALMVVADPGRALVVFGLVFAPNLATILALIVVRGIFSTCFGPARQATIAALVPQADLLAANSLSQFSFQLSKILGPVLGGLWGVGFVFTTAGSALALLGLVVFCLRPTVATQAATEHAAVQTSKIAPPNTDVAHDRFAH